MVALTARRDKLCHAMQMIVFDRGCGICDPDVRCCVQRERGSPLGLVRLVRNFRRQDHESDEQARRRFFRRIFGTLWFGNKVGKGQFRGKAVPTYVYPDCLKAAIRELLSGHLRDYPNPETPAVYIVTLTDLSQARWPGDA